jgi:hypothetical protein
LWQRLTDAVDDMRANGCALAAAADKGKPTTDAADECMMDDESDDCSEAISLRKKLMVGGVRCEV